MSNSGRLHTTPGQFDYPPASASARMERLSDSRNRRATRRTRPLRASGNEAAPPPMPSNDPINHQRGTTPPWIPSSPGARHRMQRVLRRVYELQENDDTRRGIERRLDENERRLRLNVERLRENEQRLRDTGRRIGEVEDQMRDLDNLPSPRVDVTLPPMASSSRQGTPRPNPPQTHQGLSSRPYNGRSTAALTTDERDVPVRAALREASERLRQVNDELRHLLDRPLEGSAAQLQQLDDAHNEMQRLENLSEALANSAGSHSELHPVATQARQTAERAAELDLMINRGGLEYYYDPNRHYFAGAAAGRQSSSGDTWRAINDHQDPEISFVRETNQRTRPTDEDEGHPHRKRRRLNNGESERIPRIEYGYEGQVVPGRLKMQLLSCDGGIVEPVIADLMNTSYGAENVLKDDQSVYCTKAQRCNMILQHQHQTTFCLERLVIKAPKTGFTDPVQEGLVFVSMKQDDILNRTANYQIYYFPTSRFASYFPSAGEPGQASNLEVEYPALQPARATEEQLEDHDMTLAIAEGIAHMDDPSSILDQQGQSGNSESQDDSEDDSDSSSDHTEARERRQQRMGERSNTQNNILAQRVFDNVLDRGAAARQRRQRRHLHASSSQTLAHLSNSDQSLECLRPAVHFSMHSKMEGDESSYGADSANQCENSDVMTIKFDPPLSGRFILLKMWNPRYGGNIDIQSVLAYGFAGPRWFPANEKR